MLFAETNLDWTAIAVAGLGAVMSIVGWALRQSFGKIDRHMDRVEAFMAETGKSQAVVATRVDGHDQRFTGMERWMQNLDQRVNDSRRVGEIHSMVSDLHGAEQERRTG